MLRNGALFSALKWAAEDAPSIMVSHDSEIKGSFKGSFYPDPDISWLTDELQPCLVINGKSSPLGIFRCTTMGDSGNQYGTMVSIEAYDRAWLVQSTRTETILHLSAGTNYIQAIESLLVASGIALVISTPSAAVLPYDREDWELGTDHLSIVNQLLSEIGYRDLWFDANGYARIEPYVAPSADRIVRQYSAKDIGRLPISPEYTDETDMFDEPNVFVCICSNADRASPLVATAVNDSPLSSKSVFKRGKRISQVYKVDQIADQMALQVYANRLRDRSMLSTRTVNYAILAEPGHGYGDIVAIDHPAIGGIYEELGWRLDMRAGNLMQIEAARTVIA